MPRRPSARWRLKRLQIVSALGRWYGIQDDRKAPRAGVAERGIRQAVQSYASSREQDSHETASLHQEQRSCASRNLHLSVFLDCRQPTGRGHRRLDRRLSDRHLARVSRFIIPASTCPNVYVDITRRRLCSGSQVKPDRHPKRSCHAVSIDRLSWRYAFKTTPSTLVCSATSRWQVSNSL